MAIASLLLALLGGPAADGGPAVPALLTAARHATDLELRAWATALLDEIEGRALVGPTPVTLDFRDRPLAEVLEAIASETGMGVLVLGGPWPDGEGPRITLEAAQPLPFWEAVDRLCAAADLRIATPDERLFLRWSKPLGPRRFWPTDVVVLMRTDAWTPTGGVSENRVVYAGALRISLHRAEASAGRRAPGSGRDGESMRLRVLVEPRHRLEEVGPPRLVEAVDVRGRSLLPGPEGEGSAPPPTSRVGQDLSFAMPAGDPAVAIRRLRGSVAVRVAGARRPAFPAPLDGPDGRVVHFPEGEALTVHEVVDREGAGGGIVAALTLSVPALERSLQHRGLDPRPPSGALPRLEVVDAEGRVLAIRSLVPSEIGQRITIGVPAVEGAGPPTGLRYAPAAWATIEVPFTFENVSWPDPEGGDR